MEEIQKLFNELKYLLNEHTTNRTFRQDLQDICNNLHDLKERIYSEKNEDTYEEDNIALGWALDLIDYLYKIYKIAETEKPILDQIETELKLDYAKLCKEYETEKEKDFSNAILYGRKTELLSVLQTIRYYKEKKK